MQRFVLLKLQLNLLCWNRGNKSEGRSGSQHAKFEKLRSRFRVGYLMPRIGKKIRRKFSQGANMHGCTEEVDTSEAVTKSKPATQELHGHDDRTGPR